MSAASVSVLATTTNSRGTMAKSRSRISPLPTELDISHLSGVTVLGEPLSTLVALLARCRVTDRSNGRVSFEGVFPREEWAAWKRAMDRAEPDIAGDQRPPSVRDHDRFVSVLHRVLDVLDAHQQGQGLASFRADLPHRDRRRLG
jgi:hypothetical protein